MYFLGRARMLFRFCLSQKDPADFLELIENQEWVARIFGERFDQVIHRSQGFFAGKNRTLFKTVNVPPGKLPRLVEQQWKLFAICDSTHGDLFVCCHIVENRLSYRQRPIRPLARVAQSLFHRRVERRRTQSAHMKSWEIIADRLSKAGWSLGYFSAVDSRKRTIWIADAHRDDSKPLVVRADEKPGAFA